MKERVTYTKDVRANRANRDREWEKNLNLVHAFLKIAQCTYKLKLLKEKEKEYSANVYLDEERYLEDVKMYLPKEGWNEVIIVKPSFDIGKFREKSTRE